MENAAVPVLLIGALFVEKGLITQEQLDIALDEQQRTGDRLGEILVERFGVSRLDLAGALAEQWAEFERHGGSDGMGEAIPAPREIVATVEAAPEAVGDGGVVPKRPIGEIFLERGMVSEQELELALHEQRQSGRRLGEILVGQGNLTRLELASALADQWASFQKLRPPSAPNGAETEEANAAEQVLPTPQVSAPAAAASIPSDQIDALRSRLEALGAQLDQLAATSREWREPLQELSTSLGERLDAVERSSAERHATGVPDDSNQTELEALASRVEELATALASAPADTPLANLPDRVEKLATAVRESEARLAELVAKETSGSESPGWRPEIAALDARLQELAEPLAGLDELRLGLDAVTARLEQPVVTDDWRSPLESLATDLRDRIASLEQVPDAAADIDTLRAELVSLGGRIDAIPPSSDDWRLGLEALTARLDELAGRAGEGVQELQVELATLAARLDGVPEPTDDWRGAVAELAARIDALPAPSEEWRPGLAGLAALPPPGDEWRDALAELAARIDALPAPSDEWREGLRELAARVEDGSNAERFDELRGWLEALSSRIDAILPPGDNLELAQVAENLRVRVEAVETGLGQRPGLELLAGLRDELQALSARVDGDLREHHARSAGQGAKLEWLSERAAQSDGLEERLREGLAPRLDELGELLEQQAQRIEQLKNDGPTAAQVAEALNARLEASEAVATDVYPSLDERLAALEVSPALGRTIADAESLRRELDDLRGMTTGAAQASNAYADQLVGSARAEISEQLAETRQALDERIAAALEQADGRGALEQLDGLVAAQAASFDLLRAGLQERDGLVEERLAALEKSQAKRSDVRELRDALAQVEQRIGAEAGAEDARVQAVEQAVRDGLSALGARLSETEGAYFQAGDALRRSIEHLGSAIRGADAHLGRSEDVTTEPELAATSFVAFAPTPEGYRLVELDGAPPAVGDPVEVPDREAPLVVARLGASPLPFDRRPCAYLEIPG